MLGRRTAISGIAAASIMLLFAVVGSWDVVVMSVAAQTSVCTNGVAVPDPANNPGLVSDCEALLAARDTLAGDVTLNWSAGTPIGDWEGVFVDGTPLRVIDLELIGRHLTGEIPADLGSLTNLEALRLAVNQLSGPIPSELGDLTNLRTLWLHGNQLKGEIPPDLRGLTNLRTLWLTSNQLTGEIPSELGALSSLEELSFSDNELTGSIPPELGSLFNLLGLGLSRNRFSGEIPEELLPRDLSNLQSFAVVYRKAESLKTTIS